MLSILPHAHLSTKPCRKQCTNHHSTARQWSNETHSLHQWSTIPIHSSSAATHQANAHFALIDSALRYSLLHPHWRFFSPLRCVFTPCTVQKSESRVNGVLAQMVERSGTTERQGIDNPRYPSIVHSQHLCPDKRAYLGVSSGVSWSLLDSPKPTEGVS